MRGFANFLLSKRTKSLGNGAEFVFREVVGGVAHVVQTKLPTANGGGDVPGFVISSDNGIYSTSSNGVGFYLTLSHSAFDPDYAEWQSTLEIEPQLSPESISAGATLQDLTNATDADRANVLAIYTLKSILSMG